MASAFALQRSTNWAMKTHMLRARPIYRVHLCPWQKRDVKWSYFELQHCSVNPEAMSSSLVEALKYIFGLKFAIAYIAKTMGWSHLTFICIPAIQINFISRVIPVTGENEIDKLVCSKQMGLHSSVDVVLQLSLRRGDGFESRWGPGNYKCDDHISISSLIPQLKLIHFT